MSRELGFFRASRAAGLLLFVACAGGPARFPTADPHDEVQPARAPGVAVDPVPRLPSPERSGATDASLLVLAAPRDLGAVKDVVFRFFRALVDESPAELDLLLADQAVVDGGSGKQPARAAFRTRFSQLDYAALRGVLVYRESEVEIYGPEEAHALEAPRGVPGDLAPDQVFVRVHVAVSHSGKTRLLPDEISLLLRATAASFQIMRIAEGTSLP